jgi:hypothetical protein
MKRAGTYYALGALTWAAYGVALVVIAWLAAHIRR